MRFHKAMAEHSGNWTIPNALTVARILCTPFFIALFLNGRYMAALSMFALAGVSDALDGFLARVLSQRSALGAMLDPLADKVLLTASFICLASVDWLPAWLVVTVVSRDVLILVGVALLSFWGQDMRLRIRPSVLSKITTACQMFLILAAFARFGGLLPGSLDGAFAGLIWLTAALTIASGGHYVARGLAMFGK